MGFRARQGLPAFRFAWLFFAALFVRDALATPASLTGTPIRAEVPDFRAPITVNLRELGVVTGTAPLAFATRTIQFLVNGQPTSLVRATPVGAVCVTLENIDFTSRPGEAYALVIDMQNAQGRDGPTAVSFTNTPGPSVDPQSPACLDPNSAPTASIGGGDRSIPDSNGVAGEPVAFSGIGTDAQGDRLTFQWFVDGSPAAVATGATATLSLPDGASRVTLRVTDELGAFTNTTVSVTVAPPAPRPPIASAGADRTIGDTNGQPGETVTLDGSGSSDPDGTIATYIWRNAQQATIGTTQNPSVSLPNGVNVLTLTVTDNTGLSASDTVQITVNAPQAPTANAGADRTIADTNGEDGETVTLTGSGSDADGTISRYEWRLGATSLGTGATLSAPLPNGANTVTLIVTDNVGLTGSDTVVITVAAPPRAPTATAGPDQTVADSDEQPGESVTLTGSGSDSDGTIAGYVWLLGDTRLGTTPTLTTRLPDGAHTITLIVTDNTGLTGEDTVQVTVAEPDTPEPQAPTANAGADRTLTDTDGQAGESVTLTGSGTDPDGTIDSYQWLLGDTTLGSGATLTTRLADGTHDITLVVTDDTDRTDSDVVRIVVGAPRAPTADAGPDRTLSDTDGEPGELVTLTGSATDPDGTIAAYEWLLGPASLGTGATLQARIPDGINSITLRVRDNTGQTATDVVQITVSREARAPTANAGADQSLSDSDGLPGEVATLSGTGTDADGTIATYQWFIGDTALGSGATLAARVPDGATAVTLVVTDDSGLTASDAVQITVAAPVLPIVNAGVERTVADSDLQPGESVQLTGSATTPTGTITSYEWLLGDTSLGNAATITARLPDGVNVVTLRARSSLNLVGTASVQITIGAPVRTVLADLPGLTPNERRLAAKLDEACGNVLASEAPTLEPAPGDGPPLAAKGRPPTAADRADFAQKCRGLVYSRNTAALVDAMGELLGDDFAVARTQTLLFANTQYASVMDRLIALRGGARGLSLAGLNIVVDGELVPLAELQDFAKMLLGGGASSDADAWGQNWGLWMRGNYSFGRKEQDSLSPSFDADQYALLAGVDYRFSANAVAGAALAYGNSTVEFNPTEEGGLDTESWALSLYGSLYAARNFYFDAIVNVADSSYDARRNITYVDGFGLVTSDAFGETGGLTMSAGVSGGYDFLIGGLTLSPTLGVFYIDAQIDEFTESGAGGLNLIYDEQKFKSLTGSLGLRATFAWNLPWGVLLPHLRADYVREFEDDVDVFGIRFASDPNAASTPPILVETENPDTSYWRFAAGFSAQFKYGVSGYVEYQRLESFEFISFQDVSLGLRFQRSF